MRNRAWQRGGGNIKRLSLDFLDRIGVLEETRERLDPRVGVKYKEE